MPKDFDWNFYLSTYEDLRSAGLRTEKDAIKHYLDFGRQEGRLHKLQLIDKSFSTENDRRDVLRVKVTATLDSETGYGIMARNLVDRLMCLDFVVVYLAVIETPETGVGEAELARYRRLVGEYDYYDFNIVVHPPDEGLICRKSLKNCFLFFLTASPIQESRRKVLERNPGLIVLSPCKLSKEQLGLNNLSNRFHRVCHPLHFEGKRRIRGGKVRFYSIFQDMPGEDLTQAIDCFLNAFWHVDDVEFNIYARYLGRELPNWTNLLKGQDKVNLVIDPLSEEQEVGFHMANDIFFEHRYPEGHRLHHLDANCFGNEVVFNEFGSLGQDHFKLAYRRFKEGVGGNGEVSASDSDRGRDDLYDFLATETADMIVSDRLKERFNHTALRDAPLVTLITSVKNASEFLEQFLENTVAQTIFRQCEWIMIDVNEDDRDHSIIKRYLHLDNLRYERISDSGLYSIWNHAIRQSRSAFISNFNCDDRRFSHSIECQLKSMLVNEVDVVYNDSITAVRPNISPSELKDIVGTFKPGNIHSSWCIDSDIGRLPLWYNSHRIDDLLLYNVMHNNPMWRRDIHNRLGFFDESFRSLGDNDFWLRCYFHGVRFKKIEDVLGIYYFNPKGLSTDDINLDFISREDALIKSRIQERYNLSV